MMTLPSVTFRMESFILDVIQDYGMNNVLFVLGFMDFVTFVNCPFFEGLLSEIYRFVCSFFLS